MKKNYKIVIYKNDEQVDMCETDCFFGVAHYDTQTDGAEHDDTRIDDIAAKGMKITDCNFKTAIEMLGAVKLYVDIQIDYLSKKLARENNKNTETVQSGE